MSVLLPDGDNQLEDIFGSEAVRTGLVPVVRLSDRQVVAVEVVVAGPAGSALADPDLLESAARDTGMTAELDAARWSGAAATIAGAELPAGLPVLIKVDAETLLQAPDPADLGVDRGVLVLPQDALLGHPARIVRLVDHARAQGWSIGVDRVGQDARGLALLPLLEPDLLILQPEAIAGSGDLATAQLVHAVAAHAERTGAVVMAAGVDDAGRHRAAQAMGATVGRGRHHVRARWDARHRFLQLGDEPRRRTRASSPYALAAAGREELLADKRLLIEMSKYLEMAAQSVQPVLMLGTFQHVRHFTPHTALRWEYVAGVAALAAAFGEGIGPRPATGVRGVDLDPDDPVRGEWTVLVLAPHFASVLSARDLGDGGPDLERRFRYVLSHDRDLVVSIARALLTRVPDAQPA
ncbi:EAL domain-containing protein [Nakamurella sp. YIM 132087]|uniref:EAL domain-containing protein n=1 Tax=Nakamurella alba TaxID=2665158 RepID=A0A7K1FNU5_9ACTN|nr:EAL domain-containing protein [Nakamurella alba]MTD14979.1 EAL domain-containing protein [Nakamurella alba]